MAKIKPSPVIVRNADTSRMHEALQGVKPHQPTFAPNQMAQQQPHALPQGAATGQTIAVPVASIRESQMNARVYYSTQEVDEMADSLQKHGQLVPAKGYLEADFVVLVDGQKRLRGARAGGIETLRIELCEKPANEKEHWLASRRINKERSSQTFLDDSIRFKALIAQGLYSSQAELGTDVELSQSMVARVLALTEIPEKLQRRLKDTHIPGSLDALYAISQIFIQMGRAGKGDDAEPLAAEIIDLVVKEDLSGNQTVALVASRLSGPKTRARNEIRHISVGSAKATIKSNPAKGRLDFSIKGLTEADVEALRLKIEAACQGIPTGAA